MKRENVTVSGMCPFMKDRPFELLGIVLVIGVLVVPIIWFYVHATNRIRERDKDLTICGRRTKITSISKSWRNRHTVMWVMACVGIILAFYNMCVQTVYVYVLIDVFVLLLVFAYYMNPELEDPTIPIKTTPKAIKDLSTAHKITSGLIFVFIPVIEILTCIFYYVTDDAINATGIVLLVLDALSWILFLSLYSYYEGGCDGSTEESRKDREWRSGTAIGEIIYCLMFGFTMMFVSMN